MSLSRIALILREGRSWRSAALLVASLVWIMALEPICGNSAAAVQKKDDPGTVSVSFQDRLLTVAAEGVPLADVLDRIAEVAHVSIQLKGSSDVPVSIRPVPRSIEKTILHLAHGINAVFLYTSDDSGGDVLTDIHIVSLDGDNSLRVFDPVDETGGTPVLAHRALFEKMVSIEPCQLADTNDIDLLAHILKFDSDPSSRAAAAEFLGNVIVEYYPLAAEALTQALHDPSAAVRYAAVDSLATVQTTDHAAAMAVALKDDDPQVRLGAVLTIGSMAQSEGMALAEQAFEDQDATIRVAAVDLLGQLDSPEADYLLWLAGYDEDPMVRNAANEAINQMESGDH